MYCEHDTLLGFMRSVGLSNIAKGTIFSDHHSDIPEVHEAVTASLHGPLAPFSTMARFHIPSAHYLVILYSFRNLCGGLK
ncbi:hypothetical protein E2C01_101991 [Portunus trituberculatus]|uniref:Uncharacterized protein n=1 Tax=Portunus trituberculatus TaxID=210409 RepID=A0A5B7KHE0_PORTR|nr:hypothetical protein [Portunus trituberculatus]